MGPKGKEYCSHFIDEENRVSERLNDLLRDTELVSPVMQPRISIRIL